MVQGGEVDTGNSEYLTQGVLEIIQGSKKLQEEAKNFLDKNKDLKDLDLTEKGSVILLLSSRKSEEFLAAMSKGLSEEEKFKKLAEQVGKNRVMEEKLETLGNQLLAQGLISGAAVTTLTGVLAGLLTVGGVTGALIGGGAAFVGFVALVAIAAIGYAIYQHRGEIKEGAIEAGKAVKSFVKDVIDKLPKIQDRDKNFYKLYQELSQLVLQPGTEGSEIKNIQDKAKVIEMLRNQEQKSAIQELVKDRIIKNFPKEKMARLIAKGESTHIEDKKELEELMKNFQPEIMAIGSDIEEVERKVNEKVKEMKPSPEVKNPSSKRVSEEGKGVN
ncbi:glycine zipper family protein [Wolbachia endosymbiont of Bemisia tabaci]|uniref:glycine zipper family protein n=1 Tax=Wolbachia endosymbiont of Bemisia tabaci TaxID=215173 RepID=UPI000D55F80C|nr:glycine zipper family protein [Wolbachia endosymbiont of Bemisia tabaci]